MAAEAPSQLPVGKSVSGLAEWRERGARLVTRINEHRVMLIAAGVTYYLLLSLVPTLTLFVSLYGLFNDRRKVTEHVELLSGIVPSGGLDIVRDQLTRLTSAPQSALSLTLVGSLVVALWSATAGIKALFDAMNVANEEEEKRNFFALNGLALLFLIGGILAVVVTIGAVVVIPVILNVFHIGKGFEWLVTGLGYLVMLAVLVGAIGLLYRWGPSRHHGRWHWLSPGTLLTIIATVVISILFSWYAANFGNYNATYGSLGALVGMLTWLWLTVTVLIVGAELNAEAEREAVPATAPQPQPESNRQRQRRPGIATMAILLPAVALLAWADRGRRRTAR